MAGPVPAIHVFGCGTKDVDARHRAGHDERETVGKLDGRTVEQLQPALPQHALNRGDPPMPYYTAVVTLLASLFYFYTGLRVGRARCKFGIQAPATSGNPEFERMVRVQTNTLEWMPIFLPSLWLFAIFVNDVGAAAIGIVWIVGRAVYMVGYTAAAEKRHVGFGIQALAAGVLLFGALIGVILRIAHGG
jgi:glutathione S-transferase